ncbi:Utp14 protein [Cryptosporidium felis]|nr:Utp14 protein [Cryptosporidium felis]
MGSIKKHNRDSDTSYNFTEFDKLIDRVSTTIHNSAYYRKDHLGRFDNNGVSISESNFMESTEMAGNVWKKDEFNMKNTVSNLMENLSKSLLSKDTINQFKMLESKRNNSGKIFELLSPQKQLQMERKVHYDTTQKAMKRWGPIIDRINRQEVISYGETEDVDAKSTAQLATNYEPTDEFEQEFQKVLKEIDQANSTDAHTFNQSVTPCDQIKKQSENNFMKKLKFILFQQQKENKRLRKIKSKSWRRSRRKQMQVEEEKLLSIGEVEHPELVERIRQIYEEKRAKLRLMRRQNARQKWAKMALRFGGKDLQKSVSDQAQKQQEEKKRIEQIIGNASNDYSDNECTNSDEDLEPSFASIEDIRNNIDELKGVSKELFNLKFIRRGIESRNNKLESELIDIEKEIANCELPQNNKDTISYKECPDFSVDFNKPSIDELAQANNEIHDNSNFYSHDLGLAMENVLNNENLTFNDASSSKYVHNVKPKEKVVQIDKKITINIEEELDKMAKTDMGENQLFSQSEGNVIEEIFVQGSDDFVAKDMENGQKCDLPKKNLLPGWGNWCSTFKVDTGSKEKEDCDLIHKSRSLIKANHAVDKKILKYCVNQAPHPYSSNELYESTLKHPIGIEWNTTAIHNRLIQPKIRAKIGAVIKPLKFSKHLKDIKISDSFLEKWNQVKKCNRTKARF